MKRGISPYLALKKYGAIGKDGAIEVRLNKILIVDGKLISNKDQVSSPIQMSVKKIRNLNKDQLLNEFQLRCKKGAIVIETFPLTNPK